MKNERMNENTKKGAGTAKRTRESVPFGEDYGVPTGSGRLGYRILILRHERFEMWLAHEIGAGTDAKTLVRAIRTHLKGGRSYPALRRKVEAYMATVEKPVEWPKVPWKEGHDDGRPHA